MLAQLADADPEHRRHVAATIDARTGMTVDQLYVHAKVAVVDDRWLTIGSANLNAHSFFNDTEVNVAVADPELARATRLRLWAEHLELPVDEVAGAPADVVDRLWRPIARRERERRERGEPRGHRLRELTPGLAPARAAAGADGRRRGRRLAARTGGRPAAVGAARRVRGARPVRAGASSFCALGRGRPTTSLAERMPSPSTATR